MSVAEKDCVRFFEEGVEMTKEECTHTIKRESLKWICAKITIAFGLELEVGFEATGGGTDAFLFSLIKPDKIDISEAKAIADAIIEEAKNAYPELEKKGQEGQA